MVVSTTAELSRFSYALVSVDATCSAEPDANNANRFTMTASITSRTLFDVSVFMAPEASETTRGATFFDKSDVRSSSRTLSRKETRSFSESFSLRYVGDYEARCRIFWEFLGAEIELKQKGDDSIVIGVSQNAAPDRSLSKLGECSSTAVDPVTGKTTRSFGNARTVLQGESLGFTANGFAYGEDKIFTPRNTPHLVAAIAGYYDGELLDKSIGRKKAVTKGYSSIPLATTSFTFLEVGEYTIDCALWWFLDDPKIPDFRNNTEESIKDLLRCIRDGAACLGYLNALRDVRTVTVNAVPALWSERPMEIEPAGGVPHDSPDSRATVRVYTRETTVTGHVITPPTIVLTLRDNLGLTALPNRHRQRAESCAMRGTESCWQVIFDMPFNPARVEVDANGIIITNDLVYSVSVATDRSIRGAVPSGTAVVQSKPTFSTDRQLLGVLYTATSGGGWTNRQGWTSSTIDVGDWHGVDVDSDNRVSRLELENNNLQGDLPGVLGYLAGLQYLDLSGNARFGRDGLEGNIPAALGNLANLTHLNLSNNTLNGKIPAALGNLTSLQHLDLSNNDLRGEIPASLATLPNLRYLFMDGNDLEGCIPVGLRGLSNDDLDDLDLPYCDVVLRGLSVSPWTLEPSFEADRTQYSAEVYDSRVTIAPVNDHGATFEYYVGNSRSAATDAAASAPGFQVDLACGETEVEIRVISADGSAEHSYAVEFESAEGAAPAAPAISRVSEGTGTLTAYWTAPATEDCGSAIEYYNLRYSLGEDDADWTEVRGPSSGLSYTIRGLTAGTTYRVQVQAVNEHGAGAWSATATGTPRRRSTTQRPPSQPQQGTGITADYTVNEAAGTVNIPFRIGGVPTGATVEGVEVFSPRQDMGDATLTEWNANSDGTVSGSFTVEIFDDRLIEMTHEVKSVSIRVDHSTNGETGRFFADWKVAVIDNDETFVLFDHTDYRISFTTDTFQFCLRAGDATSPSSDVPFSAHLSYSDTSWASNPGPLPSTITFRGRSIHGGALSCLNVGVANVPEDIQATITITEITAGDAGIASRIKIVEPSSSTVTFQGNPFPTQN